MSRPIIEVENLSKRYKLGQFNARTLREEVEQFVTRFRNKRTGRDGELSSEKSEIWALKNISFSVQPGEVIGIIGRNGAGKSTLLKILSRITEPTTGEARIRGRTASLLEVGTGFHSELSGRENIYLNGAILGMTRVEVKAKFDEIVAFAEVERFLDTPVKRYSSGMIVRLAFAVAAHLEPEILIVDEVLAVGDYEFQRKCVGKMHEVNNQLGRTVIFVSHYLAAVEALTNRCLLLENGSIYYCGLTTEALKKYVQLGPAHGGDFSSNVERGQHTRVLKVIIADEQLSPTRFYNSDAPLRLEITFETDGTRGLSFDVYICDSRGRRVYFYSTACFDAVALPRLPGTYTAECVFKPLKLASDEYSIDVATSFIDIGYDHYASRIASLCIPHYAPGGHAWHFHGADGHGIVAMTLVNEISFIPLQA